ncbi:MAG: dimethylsulfonioproprionate lyase family protein [Candidatus Puniceispirillaceae bacterium]|jgi:quercetin dioxygenase-like cupin family protein
MTGTSVSPDLPVSLADALAASITPTSGDSAMIDQLIGDLRALSCQPGSPPAGDPPATVSDYLPSLVAAMPSTPAATALRPYLDRVGWYQIFDGAHVPGNLATGMMAGQVIGGHGLLTSRELYMGLFLLAPHITYPLHQHAALEIYCVLSGAVSIRHGRGKPAQRIQPGGHSVTPPHQVHELRTDDQACLIAYVWTGDVTGENWWWEEQPDGSWDRVCWQRQDDSSWKITHREPLSTTEIARSGDQ